MNYYDSEANIISRLQSVSIKEVCLVNPTRSAKKFFLSLYSEHRFEKWINNSGKDALPPDFFSEKYKYMLEVMRIDDFVVGRNSPNALESKLVKEVDGIFREKGMSSLKESNIHMVVIPDLTKASKNGYSIYVENFRRVVDKHINKIKNYRKNHPGYKLGFLIFDEAPGYLQMKDKTVKVKPGAVVSGYPHIHFMDKNFIEVFENVDVDFLIWMTLNKNLPPNPRMYPEICVIDIKRRNRWKKKLIKYDEDKMMCLEVEEQKGI